MLRYSFQSLDLAVVPLGVIFPWKVNSMGHVQFSGPEEGFKESLSAAEVWIGQLVGPDSTLARARASKGLGISRNATNHRLWWSFKDISYLSWTDRQGSRSHLPNLLRTNVMGHK